jgi:predicted nucleic acid-binding protein
VNATDTSVVVAAFASWHEQHLPARAIVDRGAHLVEHCALETYSVLTRLPAPHRVAGEVVRRFLELQFSAPYLRLEPAGFRAFVLGLPARGITGGAAYDALVAATAAGNGATLHTCDRRAAAVYDRYGVRVAFLA